MKGIENSMPAIRVSNQGKRKVMSESFLTTARSWYEIEHKAWEFRTAIGATCEKFLPVMDILEIIMSQSLMLVELRIETVQDMGTAEGFTAPDGSFIAFREDVYKKAHRNDPRARFTVAHEIGHFVLHSNTVLSRVPFGAVVPPYKLTEPQANVFAASLLAPLQLIESYDTVSDLENNFGISHTCAVNRLNRRNNLSKKDSGC